MGAACHKWVGVSTGGGPGLSPVPRGTEPGPGCWGVWVPALTEREGAPADTGPPSVAPSLVGSVPSERRSRGGLPPRPDSSAQRPHTHAVPAEKLRLGAPPGQAAFLLPPLPLTGQLPRELPVLFSDHCWKALPTSGQRRPPWGFRSTFPAPQPPERFQAGGRGVEGAHSPAGFITAAPHSRPLRPPTAPALAEGIPESPHGR